MNTQSLIALFYSVDEFCILFEQHWHRHLLELQVHPSRWWQTRISQLCLSELMTITIFFHQSKYRTFKHYYLYCVLGPLKPLFPNAPSYARFISLMKGIPFPLFMLQNAFKGASEGLAFIDSTILSVSHICRASSHRVFKKIAAKGKTSTGWFFGMKLHLVINHRGEILSWLLTPGNVSDVTAAPQLCLGLFGKLCGDRGYVSSKLFETLCERGIQLITRLRSNMKNMLMDMWDKMLLYKRGIIESVIHQLKSVCQIDHHRHRSPIHFFVNLVAGLVAYSFCVQKPELQDVWVQ